MSKFSDRAAEIKAAGEEARGNFLPNGVPGRMYEWWLDNSPSEKASDIALGIRRENFCHFWRVVLFWVPLLWLGMKILNPAIDAAEKTNPKMAGAAIVVFFLGILALVATVTGTWADVLIVLACFAAILVGILAVGSLIYWLDKNTDKGVQYLTGTFLVVIVGIALFLAFLDLGFWLFAWLAGIAGALALMFGAVLLIGTVLESLRADRRKRANAAEDAAWLAYQNGGEHPYVGTAPREPGKIAKFFTGMGDFLTLMVQVVRVNKWKICPLVEVPTRTRSSAVDADQSW